VVTHCLGGIIEHVPVHLANKCILHVVHYVIAWSAQLLTLSMSAHHMPGSLASMPMQSTTHHAASSMHCPRLQQQAKWPARMLQCSSKKTSLPQHTVSVSPLCLFAFACSQSVVRHTNSSRTLQEKHRWQMAAAKAGLKVVHDSWVVQFWCGQPAAICCHAFRCPDGPVRPRLSAVCDDPCRVQLPVGRQVHVGGFREHCHHSWRCEACSVSLLPGLPAFWLLQGSPNMLRAILALFMVTCATHTHFLCVFILVILTIPYAVPKDLLQRLQVVYMNPLSGTLQPLLLF